MNCLERTVDPSASGRLVSHKRPPQLTTSLGVRRGFRLGLSPSVEKPFQSPLIDVCVRPREPIIYRFRSKRAMARLRPHHPKKLLRGVSPLPAFHPFLKM